MLSLNMNDQFEVSILRASPVMPGLTSVDFQVTNRRAGHGQALVGTEGASIISPIDTSPGSESTYLAMHQPSIEAAIFEAEMTRRADARANGSE